MEKPRVLVADDNEATCTLVRALLQNEFIIDVVSDGNEAIEVLRNRQYAAILLDLLMPIADGFAVLEFLERERPDLLRRVIVVTAALAPREMQRARAYPTCAVIAKPFDVDELLTVVRQCAALNEPHFPGPLLSGSMFLLLAADLLRHVR